MKSYFYIPILLSLLLISCKFQPDLKLTKINGFPSEIDGCSCYFAENQEDFDQKKFIYLDTYYEGTGFISINDELIKIDLENTDYNNFDIKIEFKSNKQKGAETWWKTGSLTVKTKNGETIKSDFVGQCGC